MGAWEYNTMMPRQNACHFADDIFKTIFRNANCCIFIIFSLKFVPKGAINNRPALIQKIAWHQLEDKQLSKLMMV